jgi:hypothetical protein
MPTPPSGRRSFIPRTAAKQTPRPKMKAPIEDDRMKLERDLEEILKQEAALRKLEEETKRKMEELPKKLAERERKQRERIHQLAVLTATDHVGRPRDKRHTPLRQSNLPRRMTLPEQRRARIQFLMLCAVLAFFLLLLWKSLP